MVTCPVGGAFEMSLNKYPLALAMLKKGLQELKHLANTIHDKFEKAEEDFDKTWVTTTHTFSV